MATEHQVVRIPKCWQLQPVTTPVLAANINTPQPVIENDQMVGSIIRKDTFVNLFVSSIALQFCIIIVK